MNFWCSIFFCTRTSLLEFFFNLCVLARYFFLKTFNEYQRPQPFMYCLINEQECFIRFKATSAEHEWL